MQPGHQHHKAALIAQGISALTDEQRLARQEAQQRQVVQSALQTPSEFFGTLLDRLMRWYQVASDADLPPYTTLAMDTDRIRLLGRWQSDQMFSYLHVQAEPVMRHLLPECFTAAITPCFLTRRLSPAVIHSSRCAPTRSVPRPIISIHMMAKVVYGGRSASDAT